MPIITIVYRNNWFTKKVSKNETPYEAFHCSNPVDNHLKKFSSKAYSDIPK